MFIYGFNFHFYLIYELLIVIFVTCFSNIILIIISFEIILIIKGITMSGEYTEKQENLVRYLKKEIAGGRYYIKAKHISSELGITPQEAGTLLGALSRKCLDLSIVPWSYSGTSTTWKIGTK